MQHTHFFQDDAPKTPLIICEQNVQFETRSHENWPHVGPKGGLKNLNLIGLSAIYRLDVVEKPGDPINRSTYKKTGKIDSNLKKRIAQYMNIIRKNSERDACKTSGKLATNAMRGNKFCVVLTILEYVTVEAGATFVHSRENYWHELITAEDKEKIKK